VHVVAGVGKVNAKSVSDGLTLIRFAIVVGVAKFPDVGNDGGVNIAVVMKDAGRDSSDFILEVLGINRGLVGEAIAIGVFDQVNAISCLPSLL
jgi:hypothetical protein